MWNVSLVFVLAVVPAGAAPETVSTALAGTSVEIVENRGQLHDEIRFATRGPGHATYFLDERVVHHFTRPGRGRSPVDPERVENLAIFVDHLGADADSVTGEQQRTHQLSYMIGADRSRWHSGVPTFSRVRYESLYPGIDLVYIPMVEGLKYEYHLGASARAADIRFRLEGVDSLAVDEQGNLVIGTAWGEMLDQAPIAYQEVDGERLDAPCSYRLLGGHSVGFTVQRPRADRPLVIDPQLRYASYLGGAYDDHAFGIAVADGRIYVTGTTNNADMTSNPFPTTPGAYDTTANGWEAWGDVFVSVIEPRGNGTADLLYSTFIGGGQSHTGNDWERSRDIAVAGGKVYVVGATESQDFPITTTAYDTTLIPYDINVFLSVFDATLSNLLYSTFLGGDTEHEEAYCVAVSEGRVYVAGTTESSDFPTSPGAYDETLGGNEDVFLSVINPAGAGSSDLLYSTFFGGSTYDQVWQDCIAVADDRLYLTGKADHSATDFPTTPGAYDTSLNGRWDVFVSIFSLAGGVPSALLHSTLLGGSDDDSQSAIAVSGDRVYITGTTWWERNVPMAMVFPTTVGAYDRLLGDGYMPLDFDTSDAFMSIFDSTLSTLLYSTFLGGTGPDAGSAVVAAGGHVYVVGSAFDNFPTTAGAYDTTPNANDTDAFVTVFDPAGGGPTDLLYSTMFGGYGFNFVSSMAFERGNVYLVGQTSVNLPFTPGAFDTTENGMSDLFVAVMAPGIGLIFEDGFESGTSGAWQ